MGNEWLALLGAPQAWEAALSNPVAAGGFGVLSGLYGLRKIIRATKRRAKFGHFPFARNMNITSAYFCALNAALFLLICLLITQFIIALGQTVGADSDRLRHYAEAYFPLSILLSITILGLISFVYLGIARRIGIGDEDKHKKLANRLGYLRRSLNERGFGQFEVFGLPPLALLFNLGPWMIGVLG